METDNFIRTKFSSFSFGSPSSLHNYHRRALAMRTFHRAVTGRISTQTILKAGSMIASAPGRPNYQPVDPSSREFLRAHESKLRGGRALRQPLHISILAITPEASLEPRRHVKLECNDTD